jgi:hypothetical protein
VIATRFAQRSVLSTQILLEAVAAIDFGLDSAASMQDAENVGR